MKARSILQIASLFLLVACGGKDETIKPEIAAISESVYASGIVKSKNQYQLFPTVNGVIESIYIEEGAVVKKGQPILSIVNTTQKLNKENAALAASYYDYGTNQEKLNDAKQQIFLSKEKMKNDSALFFRQRSLFNQNIGTKVELEQRELAYENAKITYQSSIVRYNDLKRQLAFTSSQSKKSLEISESLQGDYTLRSDIDGVVYSIAKEKGELVGPQTAVAVIGDANQFILEMQVDEYDIVKIRKGQQVLITMDSYKGQVFEAKVSKIYPMINERTKSFKVEAEFVKRPSTLYPNISFEASIVLRTKQKALLIPRAYLNPDNTVNLESGEKVKVTIGLKDYQKVEILSGITAQTVLILPE